ncbi:HU domain-containing protein [Draconibacterium halophilum]|uniref:SPOR domain-containing protein n=1 Tax=Draconibacterium halophilum TaxID=2706887 RepID=A0A6C0R946_9BACT|nr:SPOR domain-containing protein [Draconibacterium halophilum]QIA06870.1 SPOR domain-containing protein [Draconibacterium halophilum]
MSFGKEIYTLLLQHYIVIIPGLGAFVSEYHPADINNESDEIKPPSKTISFNQQLKNNDGVLVGHIAEKLHIPHFNALVRIEKERDEMLFKLDKGDEVFIEGVGTLSHNEKGEIIFQASEEENLLLDSFGLGAMSISEPEPPEVPTNDKIEQQSEAEPEVTEPEEQDEKKTVIEGPITDETAPKETEPEIHSEEKEKKKKKPWLFLLIIIPLLAVSVFIFMKGFNNDNGDEEKIVTTNTIVELPAKQEPIVIDSTMADSTATIQDTTLVADTIKNIPEPAETLPLEQDSVRYYLVGGSFSVKENADNYLLELQKKGYEAFHVGKKGRFFIVGISSYKTFNEANTAKMKYMEDNPGSEVWVYRK